MSDSTPFISVVIPTLNRPQAIFEVVQDFLKQEYAHFEIIVVDASDTDNEELQSLAQRESRLNILRVAPRGTCFSRNAGVAAAKGDIIVFTDDDVRIESPTFLHVHAQNYTEKVVGGVGGRVFDLNEALNREQTGRVCHVSATGRIFPNATSPIRQDINAPRGGNMSFRKQVILDVGGFDEHFRGNAMREETDFSLRVVRGGWRIVYEPNAELTHLALGGGGSRTADRLQWYRDFFFNESYFFLKHFPKAYLLLLLLRKARAMAACWLYYGRGQWPWFVAPWQAFAEGWKLAHTAE